MSSKPRLIRVGNNLVDPTDVACIAKVGGDHRDLFVVRLKSQPNTEYPIWASEKELGSLLGEFKIIDGD